MVAVVIFCFFSYADDDVRLIGTTTTTSHDDPISLSLSLNAIFLNSALFLINPRYDFYPFLFFLSFP